MEVQDECHEYQTALCPTPECAVRHTWCEKARSKALSATVAKVVAPGVRRDPRHADVPAAHASQRGGTHASLVVMRRGSLRAAGEITGHNYETIGRWLRLAAEHAEALTESVGP